ncbi:hypothetical protein EXW38_11425 [Bacillus mycoides]|nr:hypothetical protein EXW38_11425 [Bacillus mycoides]
MDTFTSIFSKKFMILLISRVRHYLTITLRNPSDKRGSFYLNKDFFLVTIHHSFPFSYNLFYIVHTTYKPTSHGFTLFKSGLSPPYCFRKWQVT